jgi:predicted DNA-binding transcriptional regulator AlpA
MHECIVHMLSTAPNSVQPRTPSTPAPDLRLLGRILSPQQLCELLGVSLATIWRMRRRNEIPHPIRLSPGRVGWPEAEIATFLASRERSR